MSGLSEIVGQYITERDNFQTRYAKRHGALFAPGAVGGPLALSSLIDAHAAKVANYLPPLNLAEMEALAELINSRLNYMRMREASK